MKKERTDLIQLFQQKRVVDLQAIQRLQEISRRSIFRDLKEHDYLSSYTHAGKYYTLKQFAQFNQEGLWYYGAIGFSIYGTLKNTTFKLVRGSREGKTHEELEKKLRVRVHNTLLDLVRSQRVGRQVIGRLYVYVSAEPRRAAQQLKRRREIQALVIEESSLPAEWIRIEILAELIRASEVRLKAGQLVSRLERRGVSVTVEQVDRVLEYYVVKKNWV